MEEQKFTWFPKITKVFNKIEDETHKLLFIQAVLNYGTYGIETELPYPINAMLESIKDDIDNSLNSRRSGSKGGSNKKKEATPLEEVAKGGSTTSEPPLDNVVTPLEEVAKGGSEHAEPIPKHTNTIHTSTNKELYSPEISEIVNYLNEKAGTSYRSSSKNTKARIKARLKEGFTVQDFKDVIDGRIRLWAKDPRMSEYIRPDTLFGSKFESYLNAERVIPTQGGELDEIFAEYGEYYDSHAIQYDPTAGELAQVAGT